MDFLAVDNFDFTRKIFKKNLDKDLTFRVVCNSTFGFSFKRKTLNFRAKHFKTQKYFV